MNQIEACERDHKHHPAGELVKETKRLVGVPVLNAEAGTDNASGVGGDRNGYAGESQGDTAPGGLFQEVAVEHGQGEETHKRADAAAGFGDFELHDGQLNDVTLVQD